MLRGEEFEQVHQFIPGGVPLGEHLFDADAVLGLDVRGLAEFLGAVLEAIAPTPALAMVIILGLDPLVTGAPVAGVVAPRVTCRQCTVCS